MEFEAKWTHWRLTFEVRRVRDRLEPVVVRIESTDPDNVVLSTAALRTIPLSRLFGQAVRAKREVFETWATIPQIVADDVAMDIIAEKLKELEPPKRGRPRTYTDKQIAKAAEVYSKAKDRRQPTRKAVVKALKLDNEDQADYVIRIVKRGGHR